MDLKTSLLLWMLLVGVALLLVYDKQHTKRYGVLLGALAIVRSLVTLGMQPTLFLLGLLQVRG